MNSELERVVPSVAVDTPAATRVESSPEELSTGRMIGYVGGGLLSLGMIEASIFGFFGGAVAPATLMGLAGIASAVGLGSLALRRRRKHSRYMKNLEPGLKQIRERLSGWLRETYGLKFSTELSLRTAALRILQRTINETSEPWYFETQDGALLKARLVLKDSRLELHKAEVSSPSESIYFDPIQELS